MEILFTVTHERFDVASFTFPYKNFAALGSLWESSFGGNMYPQANISWEG